MAAKKQLNAKKTGWSTDQLKLFKDFSGFKSWYDPKYKGMKAEEVWVKIGGVLPETKKETKE